MDALPDIASVVDGKMEIYIDGGVSVGSDVFKAIALGAKAVTTSLVKIIQQEVNNLFYN